MEDRIQEQARSMNEGTYCNRNLKVLTLMCLSSLRHLPSPLLLPEYQNVLGSLRAVALVTVTEPVAIAGFVRMAC
jgi:hypothetical protein